ncbi:hypothetical protein PAAG_06385 [Paracoccidioides lutzii Pb01]|uniref:Uncharacterized protein n=1 Tax=Paracoccidioides lutzii (strain ATCC MYA-826 / Pb01) TaxID=502779 RepID=C1H6J4_PARBA|nr:hypothetical protein PAAG_06385 [Paracoccidioides lutzii Pb01]EEH35338.2 hypothetical protein PAAG_06385 [Paracoccidioides lutzii Pb01]
MVDMLSFLSHEDMESTSREGNDVWGRNAPGGREFVAVGQTDGTAFAEILKNGELKYLGRLPTQTEQSLWDDMKVMMVTFTLDPKLQGEPVTFDIKKDLTAWFEGFGSSHNIVAHEETNKVYAVGTGRKTSCAGGLFMINVSNPDKPTSPGSVNEDGYVHGAQCVIYKGSPQAIQELRNLLQLQRRHTHHGRRQKPRCATLHWLLSIAARDPTGKKFRGVGFFDCHPEDDALGGEVEFVGSWSVYPPYFKSGTVVLNSFERGLYALKYTGKQG